jgi:teichuronic acid exporter
MNADLRSKTLHGLFWSTLERIGQQGIQLVITIILARLLLPEEFGLIAMLTLFMAVAQSIVDSGFGSALIQKRDATHLDECSIFYFNLVVGIIAALLLCAAAPLIAAFYDQPMLVPLTRVLSLNLVISSFRIIQTKLLTKRLDFKTQFKVNAVATPLSGVIGVTMAYLGFGVWSLVAQSLSSNFFQSVLLWFASTWRPSRQFSIQSLRSMFSFGSKLLLSGLLDTVFRNIYLLVIGKVFSATDLGFYSRAKSTQQLPVDTLHGTVNRVTFPVFSSVQDDKPRLKRGVRRALSTLALVNFPAMIGLAAVAHPLVHVVLTEKWLPSVPYLQLLCVVGMLYPLHAINLNVLSAQGRSDLFLRLEIIKKILVVIAISITWRWGISAMICGQIVTSMIAYYLNSYYTGQLLAYPFREQIRDVFPILTLSLLMGLALFFLGQIPFPNDSVRLATQIMAGASIYAVLCHLTKLTCFMDIESMILSRLRLSRGV